MIVFRVFTFSINQSTPAKGKARTIKVVRRIGIAEKAPEMRNKSQVMNINNFVHHGSCSFGKIVPK